VLLDYFNHSPEIEKKAKLSGVTKHSSEEFIMVNSISLAAIHLIVIIRKRFAPYLSEIKNSELALGYKGMLANKGSICISFKLGKVRMIFINCHLEAHTGGLIKRNE
jgi:hypothetical protein